MNILIVILSLIFITMIGYTAISIFNLLDKADKLLKLAYAYGLGVGLICFQLYLYSRLNIVWNKTWLLLPWLILILCFVIKQRKTFKLKLGKIPKLNKFNLILFLLIIIPCCYVILEALIRPAMVWDSWATWLFQSKVFFLENRINPEIFLRFHFYYPFIYNLLGTFIYIMVGKIDDTAVLLTSSAFYISLALLMFGFIRKKVGLRQALFFTLIYVTIQNFIRHGGRIEAGIADLPVGYFSFCCITLLLEYINSKKTKIFFLMSIFLGMIALIKPEATIISIIITLSAIYAVYKNKLYKHLWLLIFWLLPIIEWEIYKKIIGLQVQSFVVNSFKVSINSSINAVWGTVRELVNIKSWNLLWVTYFYTLFAYNNSRKGELGLLNFILLFQFSVYMLIYVFLSGSYAPDSSIERLLIHIAPIALYEIAVITAITDYSLVKKVVKRFRKV